MDANLSNEQGLQASAGLGQMGQQDPRSGAGSLFTIGMEVFQYFSNRCSYTRELGMESQEKIQKMIRKEKAYVWVTCEVRKVIRLWFLLGQLDKLIFYSIIFIRSYLFNHIYSTLYIEDT